MRTFGSGMNQLDILDQKVTDIKIFIEKYLEISKKNITFAA